MLSLLAGELPVDGLEDVMVTFRRQLYVIRLASDISLEALLTEVARRQRILRQLAGVLTADAALARNPHISPESIRVSALQWALLIRVRHGSTPRDLAWDLSRSVFGTTAEVYKLLARRLLPVAGDPARPHGDAPGKVPGPGLAVMSFVWAVSVEKGETVPIVDAEPVFNAGVASTRSSTASGATARVSPDRGH